MAVRDCLERSPGYPLFMSTLAEIESAVASLPRAEKEQLHARLGVELKKEIAAAATNPDGRLAALEALQRSLNLDDYKVRAWQALIRDARR